MVSFSRPPDSVVSRSAQAETHFWKVWLGGRKCETLSSIVCAPAEPAGIGANAITRAATTNLATCMFPPGARWRSRPPWTSPTVYRPAWDVSRPRRRPIGIIRHKIIARAIGSGWCASQAFSRLGRPGEAETTGTIMLRGYSVRRLLGAAGVPLTAPIHGEHAHHDGDQECKAVPGEGVLQVVVGQVGSDLPRLRQAAGRLRSFLVDEERRHRAPVLGGRHGSVVAHEPQIASRIVGGREQAARLRPAQRADDLDFSGNLAGGAAPRILPALGNEAAIDHHQAAVRQPRRREDPITRA